MLPLFLILSTTAPQTPAATAPVSCDYDAHLLDLGFAAVDQNEKAGWRAISRRPGCEAKAADLVRDYREQYQAVMPLLYWHEAQLRAFAGQIGQAIALMEASRQPEDKDSFGWNPYVDATIAFLRNDRGAFLRARTRLDGLKRPDGWSNGEWPQNGRVLAGLWACFGKPYKVAYGSCRRADRQSP